MNPASVEANRLTPAINTRRSFSRIGCRFLFALTAAIFSCAFITGCDSQSKVPQASNADGSPEPSPLQAAKRLLAQREISAAKDQIRQALIASPRDVESLRVAAEIFFAEGNSDESTRLFIEAARQGEFSNQGLVQRSASELLRHGKLFEVIELLEEVIQKQPNQSETRRNLFYFLVNAEQHRRAQHHGRILVRQRAFDKTVLFWMATYEQRDISPSSMNAFFQQNNADRRLEIGKLRVLFDNGQWEQFEAVAREILAASPGFIPAQLLVGQSYVRTGQFPRLTPWTQEISPQTRDHWQYWEVLGDWAMHSSRYPEAARAYFEASQRDPAIGSVATKLARSLQLCDEATAIPPNAIEIASERGELLDRFLQEKERYHKLHRKSNAAIANMATTLEELGRLWEAEAWTAIGLSEPDADAEQLSRIRARLVEQLRANPPWQLEQEHSLVSLELGFLPLPKAELMDRPVRHAATNSLRPSATPKLVEQSKQRGLIDSPSAPVTIAGGVIPLFAQLGFGGAAVDFDNDGWPDVYLASTGKEPMSREEGRSQLYRNVDGTFRKVGDLAGIDERGFPQGVVTGDINEDGFPDLVVLHYGVDQVFLNNGDGTFRERADWLPEASGSWSTSGAIADVNGDGISDFVCLKYCTAMQPLRGPCTVPGSNAVEYCAPTDFPAELDQFYCGQANGGWLSANESWKSKPTIPGRGLGLIVGQLDATPGMDVFVANDMTSNHFWSFDRRGSRQLRETGTLRGLALDARSRPQASMGIAAGDFDGDEDMDFLVTNFDAEHNTLYDQTDNGIWQDRSSVSSIFDSSFDQLGFGVQAVDLDNDSQLELVVANGHVHHNAITGYAQNAQVFRREASGGFEVISPSLLNNYFRSPHVGRALFTLDFDRDHRLDLIVTHQRESTALLHNQTPEAKENHWLRVRLVGVESARDAVGSVISVSCDEIHLTKAVVAGDGFFCSAEDGLHFGFGSSTRDKEVQMTVTWPTGDRQHYRSRLDRECLIVEGEESLFMYPSIDP